MGKKNQKRENKSEFLLRLIWATLYNYWSFLTILDCDLYPLDDRAAWAIFYTIIMSLLTTLGISVSNQARNFFHLWWRSFRVLVKNQGCTLLFVILFINMDRWNLNFSYKSYLIFLEAISVLVTIEDPDILICLE